MRVVPLLAAGALLTLTACSGDDDNAAGSAVDLSLVPMTAPSATAPSVPVPDEIPTELVVTTLVPGEGRAAAEGDSVLFRYVGIDAETGEQFDSTYDLQPIPVTLGAGDAMDAWETGLLGVQAGSRVRLDVPADEAFGPAPTTPTDGTPATATTDNVPYGPLTFVFDVAGVIPPTDPADAPTAEDFDPRTELATEVTETDLRVGDGPAVAAGMTAVVHFVLARADNGVVLRTSWDDEGPTQVVLAPTGQMDGMAVGMEGMRAGGRRLITVPYEDAFGANGFPQAGLPAATDVQVIVDLLASY